MKEFSEKKVYNVAEYGFLIIYFFKNFLNGLIQGGRWDLYQHIATADRFLQGKGFYYSATEASSPYFPGIGFLSVLVGKICPAYRDYILLFLASLIGTLLIKFFIELSKKLGANKWITLVLSVWLCLFSFLDYQWYMREFKPDAIVLLLSGLICFFIEQPLKTNKNFLLFVFLLIITPIFKQHGLYTYIATFMFVCFFSKKDLKEKIILSGGMFFSGLLVLAIIFSIHDIRTLTIENLHYMAYWSVKEIIHMFIGDFREAPQVYFLGVLFIVLLCTKKMKLSLLGVHWLLISIIFCVMQLIGACKSGGNSGNIQVGLFCFLPFACLAISVIYEQIPVHIKRGTSLCLLVAFFAFQSVEILYISRKACKKLNERFTSMKYLQKYYNGKKFLYASDDYMLISRGGIIPDADLYTIPYCIPKYYFMSAELLEGGNFEYVLLPNLKYFESMDEHMKKFYSINVNNTERFQELYQLEEFDDMPDFLKGKIYSRRK